MCNISCGRCSVNQIIQFGTFFINNIIFYLFEAENCVSNPSFKWIERTHKHTLRSSVCAYTLLRRVLIHADCRWPSPTPSTTLPLYEMITCFIQTKLQLGHDFQRNATVSKWGQCITNNSAVQGRTNNSNAVFAFDISNSVINGTTIEVKLKRHNQPKNHHFDFGSLICEFLMFINDCVLLQHDIESLLMWSYIWGMDFNIDKCNVLSITRNNLPFIF